MQKNLSLVLVVEDDKASQKLLDLAFKNAGMESALIFKDKGEEALHFLKTNMGPRPDLVILDLNLPGKNGLEILEEIRRIPSFEKIFVVLLTGSSHLPSEKISPNDASKFLLKPLHFKELVSLVRSLPEMISA